MTKKNLFTLVLCLFCFGTTTHAQRIPTLEEAVYGGLIKTYCVFTTDYYSIFYR